jgi:endonuclease/exonuclease/phosphatase (EEP) superfamily protein YafD
MTWTATWYMIGERSEVWERLQVLPKALNLQVKAANAPQDMVLQSEHAEGGELVITLERSGLTTQVTVVHTWADAAFWHIPDVGTWWAMIEPLNLVPKEADIELADQEVF